MDSFGSIEDEEDYINHVECKLGMIDGRDFYWIVREIWMLWVFKLVDYQFLSLI
jgi:hypothetical protein